MPLIVWKSCRCVSNIRHSFTDWAVSSLQGCDSGEAAHAGEAAQPRGSDGVCWSAWCEGSWSAAERAMVWEPAGPAARRDQRLADQVSAWLHLQAGGWQVRLHLRCCLLAEFVSAIWGTGESTDGGNKSSSHTCSPCNQNLTWVYFTHPYITIGISCLQNKSPTIESTSVNTDSTVCV